MAQSLELNIKTTSDVPQAMDKAKAATVSFGRQVEDIQRKFSTAFKDIALGFVAPMVIFQNIISSIKDDIEKAKQDAKDGLDLIAKGETKFATSEQKKRASFVQFRIAQQEEEQKVKLGAQKIYEDFLNTREAQGIYNKFLPQFSGPEGEATMFTIPEMAKSQKVRDEIEKWFRENQDLMNVPTKADNKPAEDAAKARQKELDKAPTSFKGPEGFSNVVGVGANPVMEAINAQLEEQRKQTALLERIAGSGNQIPTDFTKSTAAPSRASMLK